MANIPTSLSKEIKDQYKIKDNTFTKEVDSDVAKKLELEVGDATDTQSITAIGSHEWDVSADLSIADVNLGYIGWTGREALTLNDNTRSNDHEDTHGDGADNTPKLIVEWYGAEKTSRTISSAKAQIEATPVKTVTAKAHIRKNWNPDVAFTLTTSYIYNLNNSLYKVAWKFRYNGPATPIDKVALYTWNGGAGTSPYYRVGLQALDGNGNPTGTWLGATNSGYVDTQLNNSQAYQEFTLSEDVTLVNGTEYALVIEYQSGTIDGSNFRQVLYRTYDAGVFSVEKPHFEPYDPPNKDYWQPNWGVLQSYTSPIAWSEVSTIGAPIFYVVTTASEYYGPAVARIANLGIYSTTRYGLKFVAEEGQYIKSLGTYIRKYGSPADNLYYQIIDVTAGNVEIASGTLATAAQIGTTNTWKYVDLPSDVTFLKGNNYAVIFSSPSSADGSNCYAVATHYGILTERTTKYKNGDLYYSTNGGASYSTYTNYLPPIRVEVRDTFPAQTIQASAYIQKPGYVQRRIGYSSDDAFDYENIAYAPSYYTANNTRQGHRDPDGTYGDCTAGYRFRNIDIPKGAAIMSAYFKGTCYFTEAFTVDLLIKGVDLDNASDFTSEAPSDKTPLTSAGVPWTSPTCTENDLQTTPDLRSIIDEIINRDNWDAGNAIELIFLNNGATGDDNRNFKTWDYGNLNDSLEQSPMLVIETGIVSSQTISAKASIESAGPTQQTKTITAKARLQKQGEATISAKSRIGITSTKTITAKGRIGLSGTAQTIEAKAKIVCISIPVLISPAQFESVITPFYLIWEIPTCCKGRNMHAHVQIDRTDNTFGDLEKELFSYKDSGFQYWNGASWQTYPTIGVTSAYYGNQARILVNLTPGTKYWRVRGGVK